MAMARLPLTTLNLKQFLQRQKVLGLYRNILRTIRQVPEEADRKYLKDWAREEFKRNKEATDQLSEQKTNRSPKGIKDAIRMMITQANNHLEELKRSLALAGR
ncbi:LYR motif-containing protein 2 isoform X1 [Neoarius graeffei]|uniref:LYR motif-containing protein 2 isoform X1 n=1 Tax=Neoarius graeffei TaxID=443677 RepID=UPI00298BF1F7|nr:LYR motif-containing protein 2 isoform X1 [Neoarius graeffei]